MLFRSAEAGRAKWNTHNVQFRDDGEAWNHYTNGKWGGIVSRAVADMVANAK